MNFIIKVKDEDAKKFIKFVNLFPVLMISNLAEELIDDKQWEIIERIVKKFGGE